MRIIKDFKTEAEKDKIINLMSIKLVEVQCHSDGNHLVFDDGEPELSVKDELYILKKRIVELESKVVIK